VLGEVGGRQRDGDPAVGPVEAGVAEGGADAVARLEHGGVAEAHHGDRGEAAADVDLDADRVGDEADQRGGRQPGEHRSEHSLQVVDRRRPAPWPQPNVSCTRTTSDETDDPSFCSAVWIVGRARLTTRTSLRSRFLNITLYRPGPQSGPPWCCCERDLPIVVCPGTAMGK